MGGNRNKKKQSKTVRPDFQEWRRKHQARKKLVEIFKPWKNRKD